MYSQEVKIRRNGAYIYEVMRYYFSTLLIGFLAFVKVGQICYDLNIHKNINPKLNM
jgi:hypothetical protein